MAEQFVQLEDKHIEFIGAQQMFFVGTAGARGCVNVSPKGMDSFRILDASRVAWMNLTGSGNESAAHVLENRRMTIMFCSFGKQPLIMRLYGEASVYHARDEQWPRLSTLFPDFPGVRQVFQLQLDMVQTSCGYAVPYFEFQGQRPTLLNWTQKHEQAAGGIQDYWRKKNMKSLDGGDTGIFEDE